MPPRVLSQRIVWIAGTVGVLAVVGYWVRDPRIASLLANTLRAAIGTLVPTVLLAVPLALLLVRTDLPLRRMLLVGLGLQLVVPVYLQAAAWRAAFAKLGSWTGSSSGLVAPLLDGWSAVLWIHTAVALPWAIVILASGLRAVPAECEEAASLDAPPLLVAMTVSLRFAAPALIAAAIWTVYSVVGDMTVTDLFQVRTYAEQVYVLYRLGDDSLLAGAELGTGLLVIALLGLGGVLFLRRMTVLLTATPPRDGIQFPLGVWRWPVCGLVFAGIGLLLAIPLTSLVHELGMRAERTTTGMQRIWSSRHAWETLATVWNESRADMWTSLTMATSAATLTMLFAVPLAWLARQRSWRALPAWLVAAFSLATPAPLVGCLVIRLSSLIDWPPWNHLVDRTLVPTCVALAFRVCPIPMAILLAVFRSFPQDQLDQARLDGARTFIVWTHLIAPQRLRELALAWGLAALLAGADVATSILILPPGQSTTVPIRVFELLHSGVTGKVAALCLLTLAFTAAAGVLLFWLNRRRADSRGSRF